ncbi:peptide chain release factor 2 [candidate division TA06 bacterium DG_24]|uniref:Peptide chain release factor 2 n=3 Tax=Bacteria division TA06 TaxID=1156500 RepID=A0A0S8JMT0_UNCT6|nr:MAG: peptide chain release factor 2 [candidate division TA06 bacterium DG_24]KPK69867.1 MAG: peptide chain release factor 2 [candidate division TA06 bacterium SM23_40]KPL10982.1 MAG: peptide chain release factor 2 [candidate division TA06 bacterium SM1_40]
MARAGFWDDRTRAQETLETFNAHKGWIEAWQKLEGQADDISVLVELVEEDDEATRKEIEQGLERLREGIEDIELRHMLRGEDDERDAILAIHPGAGGTESQDWAGMLFRMYLRWAERRGYQHRMLDFQPGEEAGIKNATIELVGRYAYGYLKAENGVHRLVRISPFDASHRRHTSFASIFVTPAIEDDIEVDIRDSDLRVDTFRSSGAGGQHVNKTDSAVRITHIPTGIVATCQNERSQHQNRANAMLILRSRLYQYYRAREDERLQALEDEKTEIAWGNQIRSYVFHPYNLVKDHRTKLEAGNTGAVMDGAIDEFIRAYLIQTGSPAATDAA